MSAEKVGEQQENRRRRPFRKTTTVVETPQEPVLEKGMTAPKGRATPSRRRREEEEETEGNVITRTGGGLSEYVEGVQSELGKVAWPSREETIRLTIIVLATLIASSLILGIISALFTELFRIGLSLPAILLGFMVLAVGAGLAVARVNSRRSSSY
jgi:preprotein translocase subunit SecE